MLFIEVYSVVLISALQQGDSVTYMYLCMYIVSAYIYIYNAQDTWGNFQDQGLNLRPLQCKCGVLTTT